MAIIDKTDRPPHSPPRDEWRLATSSRGVRHIKSRFLHLVHEVEEPEAPPALFVRGHDLAGRHLEGANKVDVPLRL